MHSQFHRKVKIHLLVKLQVCKIFFRKSFVEIIIILLLNLRIWSVNSATANPIAPFYDPPLIDTWVNCDNRIDKEPCVRSGVRCGMVSMEEQFQRRSAKVSRQDTEAATAASHTVDINWGCRVHVRTCSRLNSPWCNADQHDDFSRFFVDQWRRVLDVHLNVSRSHWLRPLDALKSPFKHRIILFLWEGFSKDREFAGGFLFGSWLCFLRFHRSDSIQIIIWRNLDLEGLDFSGFLNIFKMLRTSKKYSNVATHVVKHQRNLLCCQRVWKNLWRIINSTQESSLKRYFRIPHSPKILSRFLIFKIPCL